MALVADIGVESGSLFVGEDKTFDLEVLSRPVIPGNEASRVPIDISGWDIVHDVRKKDGSPDPAIFQKHGTIIGVWNAVRATNTQRARYIYTDTELNTVRKHTYRHSFKRMDDGSETVIAWGDFAPDKATAP
jgi:hypothetical protein